MNTTTAEPGRNLRTPYWQRLEDPRWQKLRLEVFNRDDFACRYCGDREERLEVHHLYYVSGREPWEYPLGAFKTACKTCHKEQRQEPTTVSEWERFCGLQNAMSAGTFESDWTFDLVENLEIGWRATEEPNPGELLSLISEVLREGLIDQSTIKKWQAELKLRRLLSAPAPTRGTDEIL
jgi:hypothetical protein